MPDLLNKSNITYLEMLFSPEIDTFGLPQMEQIIKNREDLVRLNLTNFFRSNLGIYNTQRGFMEKRTDNNHLLFDKHGYDTKAFYLSVHFLTVLWDYKEQDFHDFASLVWYEGGRRQQMLECREGVLSASEAFSVVDNLFEKCLGCRDIYSAIPENVELSRWLEDLVESAIKDNLVKQFSLTESLKKGESF